MTNFLVRFRLSKEKNVKKITFFILFLFCVIYLNSQTIEEQMLQRKEQKIRTYIYQARLGDRDAKIDVLDQILAEFDEMKYTEKDMKLVELLVELAEEGSVRKVYENGRIVNDFPDVRIKAVKVLAKIKGEKAREALVNALLYEENTMVKVEICYAMAEVGDNKNGDVLRSIIYIYRNRPNNDANLIMAIIHALQKIATTNSSLYPDVVYILIEISMGAYSRTIRETALKVLDILSKQ